jgi:hypothetical protein
MIDLFGSGAQGYITLALVLVTGTAWLFWLVSCFVVIQRRPDDESDGGDGPGGGGGSGPGGGGPGPGGLESDPRRDPLGSEPPWWPEFERQFAAYTSSAPASQ